jgi:V/A-type H+/Na+-transporting ATPase subunit D
MAILKVNPTRIELLNLKRKLRSAEKGHKLLKDKRDGLMKQFMKVIRDAKETREGVEEHLGSAFTFFVRASSAVPRRVLSTALMMPNVTVDLDVDVKSVMSVKVPKFRIEKKGNPLSYGFLETSGELDRAITAFDGCFVEIVKLAELEKTAELMAEEIEKTRRRVSALENIMIPNIKETIAFISMRLEEQARDAIVSTMRVKAMIVEKERIS